MQLVFEFSFLWPSQGDLSLQPAKFVETNPDCVIGTLHSLRNLGDAASLGVQIQDAFVGYCWSFLHLLLLRSRFANASSELEQNCYDLRTMNNFPANPKPVWSTT
jgi:hypothetical protein